jgi:endonuclease YncB( thermonuclease family)
VQINEGHAFTSDRAELIAMLDEALARARQKRLGRSANSA